MINIEFEVTKMIYSLNVPPTEFVPVKPEALRAMVVEIFQKVNLSGDHSELIADLLIDTDLRGVLSHGTRQVNGYANAFLSGHLNTQPQIKIISDELTTAIVDGDGGLGHIAMKRATELAIAKAKKSGVGVGVSRNHGHYGSAGKYVRLAIRQDCAAFSVSGGVRDGYDPNASVWHSQGNPPMCFGFPAKKGPPVIVDFAIDFFYDKAEHFNTLFYLAPAAFFKCIGLGATSNLLGGALAGMMLPGYRSSERKYPNASQGGFICVIDISRFAPIDVFKAEVDKMTQGIKTMKPFPGLSSSELPGGLEWEREQKWAKEGIPIGKEHQRTLEAIADKVGVAVPWKAK